MAWTKKSTDEMLRSMGIKACVTAAKIEARPKKPRLTPDQKKALAAYNFALAQEDRYLGSVFANPQGQKRYEAATAAAFDRCKKLGMTHEHGL